MPTHNTLKYYSSGPKLSMFAVHYSGSSFFFKTNFLTNKQRGHLLMFAFLVEAEIFWHDLKYCLLVFVCDYTRVIVMNLGGKIF